MTVQRNNDNEGNDDSDDSSVDTDDEDDDEDNDEDDDNEQTHILACAMVRRCSRCIECLINFNSGRQHPSLMNNLRSLLYCKLERKKEGL